MVVDGLKKAIGTKYRLTPLKGRSAQLNRLLRRLHFEGGMLSPFPYRVETYDGRVFKLLVSRNGGRHAIRSLLYIHSVIPRLDFVPRIRWSCESAILLDFVRGESPVLDSPEFGTALGRSLACLHQVDVDTLPAGTIIRTADKHIADLVDAEILDLETAREVRSRLELALPGRIRTSADYVDIQRGNFCVDSCGQLVFVDIGGFQIGRITGGGFLGHPGSERLDSQAFAAAYRAAGGSEDIFEYRDLIVALNDLRRSAKLAVWARGALFRIRKRAALRARAVEFAAHVVSYARSDCSGLPNENRLVTK